MGVSSERQLLEESCKQKLLSRWPECEFLAIRETANNKLELVVELSDGSIGIVEKMSRKTAAAGTPMSRKWSLDDIESNLCRRLLRAVRLGLPLFHASYRASRVYDKKSKKKVIGINVSLARQTTPLTWQKIFPDEAVPEMAQWTVSDQTAKKTGQFLVVLHTLKAGKSTQRHEYKLRLDSLSKAIVDSTLTFKTFPFNVPHSHKITENRKVTYDRSIDDWDLHAEQKGLLQDSNVQTRECAKCGQSFFDTSSHEKCCNCFAAEQRQARTSAITLCKKAEKLADSSDWKETAESLKQLQQQWQQLKSIPREDSDKLWARFRGATQSFFDRRAAHFDDMDQERLENERRARLLIADAKKWLECDDWRTAGARIKELQQEWKQVNPLPRERADDLWQEFRGYCQAFFDRGAARYQSRKQD